MRALAFVLGAVALATVALRAHLPELGPALVLLTTLTIWLELEAVPVAPRGRFSLCAAPVMALGILQGPASGAVALVLAVLLRLPLAERQEDLTARVPALMSLAVLTFWPQPVAGVVSFSLLAQLWPSSSERVLELFRVGCVVLLGPAMASLQAVSPWACLLPAPVLLGGHQLARIHLRRQEATRVGRASLQARERKAHEALRQVGKKLDRTRDALECESLERGLLQELSGELAGQESLQGVVETILEAATQLVPCQGATITLLGQQTDPLARRCAESGSVVVEGSRAALPMQREAVLLVERCPETFLPLERQFLLVLAGAGGLGIQSARRFAAGQEALGLHQRANARLKVWVERLAFLLESARRLTSGLKSEEILARLQELLRLTLPHHHGAILASNPRYWPEPSNPPDVLVQAGQPTQAEGWVVCPALSERGIEATIALATEAPYAPEQLDVLSLICYQAGVALRNAALHHEAISAQAQLVQASKLAAVGQLAAGIAHELNTPLCSALVSIEMARLDLEMGHRGAVQSRLEEAERASERCQEIIQKLLYYARDAVDTQTDASLGQIVRDTLELLGGQLRPPGLSLELELVDSLPPIQVDAHELQQVVSNLLLNARDAVLSEGASACEIRLRTCAGPDFVELSVSDRGPGIPPGMQEEIFEPFFTTKPAGQGTGLGLSVSREIVSRHGGSLTVASVPGKGATFRLRLPRSGQS